MQYLIKIPKQIPFQKLSAAKDHKILWTTDIVSENLIKGNIHRIYHYKSILINAAEKNTQN